jgi:hypothetical protein
MESPAQTFGEVARSLGLRYAGQDAFYGKVQGFPTSLKIIDPAGAELCLIEAKFPSHLAELHKGDLSFEEPLASLIRAGKAETSLEKRSVWLTLNEGGKEVRDGRISELIRNFFEGIERAGFGKYADQCHYCLTEKVAEPIWYEGRVLQICSKCFDARVGRNDSAAERSWARIGALNAGLAAAAVFGGLVWASLWVGSDFLFRFLDAQTIILPRILVMIIFGAIGLFVAGPAVLVFRWSRQTGSWLAGPFAAWWAFFSVIVGEYIYALWLIWHEYKVVAFQAGFRLLPKVWLGSDFLFLLTKLLAAAMAVGIAYTLSRKKAVPVDL